ncbi:MAG: ArsC family (seleno)protein [Minicystis sp.]
MSCGRAQEFLAQEKIEIERQTDAKKERFDRDAALRLVREATDLWVAKGKSAVHVDLTKSPPSDDELAALVIGPSGNLRAPVLKRGTTLLVGFDAAAYAKVFGLR